MAGVKETAASNGCTLGEEMSRNLDRLTQKWADGVKEWAGNLNKKAQKPMDNSDIKPFEIKNKRGGR